MIPDEVCHYTKSKILEKILTTGKIKIGLMRKTNDPRESKQRNYPVFLSDTPATYNTPISEIEDWHKKATDAQNKLNRIALDEWKVFCTTLHLHPKSETNVWDRWTKEYNVLFRQGYSHPRMWAQYAENHKGVCIVFNGIALNQNIQNELKGRCRKILQGPVKYKLLLKGTMIQKDEIDRNGINEGIRKHFYKKYRNIFLTKHTDWEHEVEYRWLIHSVNNKPEYVPIVGAIETVILGVDFPESKESKLKELCQGLKIPIKKMGWQDGLPTSPKDIFTP